jgi:hypothetical protein
MHRERLGDPAERAAALNDIGWDSGQSVVGGIAESGGAAGATLMLGLAAEGTGVVATTIAGSAVLPVVVPLAAGVVASYGATKLLRLARDHLVDGD